MTYLPKPTSIAVAFWEQLESGRMQSEVGHTLTAVLIGWLLAGIVGVVAGSVLGLVHPVWRYSMASVDALRSLPIVAFVPVAVLLLGYSIEMEILVGFSGALWPVLLNTQGGMRRMSVQLADVGQVLNLSRFASMWKLRLPAATTAILVGLRLGLALALILTLVAEMIGNPAGVGYAIVQSAATLHPAEMFAYVLVTGVLGIVLNALLVGFSRLVFPGQMSAARDVG